MPLTRARLERLPPFRNVKRRQQAIQAVRAARSARRWAFEHVGSDRFSQPAASPIRDAIERYLGFNEGFFVEAGAADGFRQSNTYALERFRGWNGVLVEPVPEAYRLAVSRRPRSRVYNCALVAPEDAGSVMELWSADLGSHLAVTGDTPPDPCFGWAENELIRVPARTLTSILEELPPERGIDFLSLDLEGHEPAALRGLDLDRFAPRFVLVEIFHPDDRQAEVLGILGKRYEILERVTERDVLFALKAP